MPYVRNTWYVGAWADDVVTERPLGIRLLDRAIVLWRSQSGRLAAFEDRCVHRFAPLSFGRCEGERLRCMYHGLLYDRAGRVVEIPGQEQIPGIAQVRTYPIVERHGWVWIWMGERGADENLIPPIYGLDHPDFSFRGDVDYAAEAQLVNENLLDLGHASFLHIDSFRYTETWAREAPTVTPFERGVRSERWICNQGIMGIIDAQPVVDTFFSYTYFVPGILLMRYRTYPVGTADGLKGEAPDLDAPLAGFPSDYGFTSQAITPLTHKTARYLYIMGNGSAANASASEANMAIVNKAFAEDKMMIEGQQRNLDMSKDARFMPTLADRGIILFNQLIEKLAAGESKHPAAEA